jgi:hypothetical protein
VEAEGGWRHRRGRGGLARHRRERRHRPGLGGVDRGARGRSGIEDQPRGCRLLQRQGGEAGHFRRPASGIAALLAAAIGRRGGDELERDARPAIGQLDLGGQALRQLGAVGQADDDDVEQFARHHARLGGREQPARSLRRQDLEGACEQHGAKAGGGKSAAHRDPSSMKKGSHDSDCPCFRR